MKLKMIQGVEGNSLYLNDYRIAGPKPWGGGAQLYVWDVDILELLKDIKKVLKRERLQKH